MLCALLAESAQFEVHEQWSCEETAFSCPHLPALIQLETLFWLLGENTIGCTSGRPSISLVQTSCGWQVHTASGLREVTSLNCNAIIRIDVFLPTSKIASPLALLPSRIFRASVQPDSASTMDAAVVGRAPQGLVGSRHELLPAISLPAHKAHTVTFSAERLCAVLPQQSSGLWRSVLLEFAAEEEGEEGGEEGEEAGEEAG